MAAPPARNEISDDYPNPSNAVARVGFGKLWDYITGLLGSSGDAEDARVALGVPPAEDADLTGSPTATTAGNGENSTRIATTAWVRSAMANIASAAGFVSSVGVTSYFILPSWLGSWIIQFGSTTGSTNGASAININFGMTFPGGLTTVLAINGNAAAGHTLVNTSSTSSSGFAANCTTAASGGGMVGIGSGQNRQIHWIAFGR